MRGRETARQAIPLDSVSLSAMTKHFDFIVDLLCSIKKNSKCPEGRQHSCVIVSEFKLVVSTGYNGAAYGERECDCDGLPKAHCLAQCLAVHAEVNALAHAARVGVPIRGAAAWVTKGPCWRCRSMLKQAGVFAVAWMEGNFEEGLLPNHAEILNG